MMTAQKQPAPHPLADAMFPAESFREAAPHLRRPFATNAVRWKLQATWPKGEPHSALIVAYIDARLVIERLNLVIPQAWEDEYVRDGNLLWCRLTVDGVTRRDVGEGYVGKGLVSDALKRAAVKFGVGVSLYAMSKIVLKKADGYVDPDNAVGKASLKMTWKGEVRCRQLYEEWLKDHGVAKFGPPLDHGDADDAVGDVEATEDAGPDRRPRVVRDNEKQNGRSEQESVEAALRLLLAQADPLAPLRKAANEAMLHVGTSDRHRLQLLKDAPEKRELEDLIRRVNAYADQQASTE